MTIHIVTREQSRRRRTLGAVEPRVVVPERRLTPLLERPDGPPAAKLSPAEAERLLGIPVRVHGR